MVGATSLLAAKRTAGNEFANPSGQMDSHYIEMWTCSGDLRCLMRPHRDGWELCLFRQHHVVMADVFVDAAAAVAAADEWRHRLESS